ncbi:MAG: inner-rane translocator [Pseudomonadota bacterium]|jgi:branched-chain amino acid transport system permease protein
MRIGDFRASYTHDEALLVTPAQRSWMVGFVLLLLIFPWIGGSYLTYLVCLTGIHVIAAMGLNIVTGYAGQISLGHAAFMGVGCYTVAALAKVDVPFYLALPLAGLVSALVGLIVGVPSLRIKGLYLAVATLAAQFILLFVFREWDSVTGGVRGVNIAPAEVGGWVMNTDREIYYLIVACALVMLLGARNLFRTHIGRSFIAIRDKDISAEVLGIDLFRGKLMAFALGSFYAGVAGGLMGYFYRAITPEHFTLALSVFYLAAIIVGGLGTVLGVILGAAFMTLVPEVLRGVVSFVTLWAPNAMALLSPVREMVFGALIIAFLIFEPHGLVEIWRRIRRFFHLWPFKT